MATAHNDLDDTLRQFKEDLTHRIYMQSSSLRKVFRSLDKDASGSITRDELIVALRRFNVGGSDGPALVKQLVDEYDPDGNGEIGFEEFAQMLKIDDALSDSMYAGHNTGHQEKIMSEMDRKAERVKLNSSPEIQWDVESLREAIMHRIYMQSGSLRKVFRSIDKDASGIIGFDQLNASLSIFNTSGSNYDETLREMFDQCDPDGSGEISFGEFSAMLKIPDSAADAVYSGYVQHDRPVYEREDGSGDVGGPMGRYTMSPKVRVPMTPESKKGPSSAQRRVAFEDSQSARAPRGAPTSTPRRSAINDNVDADQFGAFKMRVIESVVNCQDTDEILKVLNAMMGVEAPSSAPASQQGGAAGSRSSARSGSVGEAKENAPFGVQLTLNTLKQSLAAHGARGIHGLGRKFRIMDDDGSGTLSYDEFTKALKEHSLGLTDKNMRELFSYFDKDGSTTVTYDEFLAGVRGALNDRRRYFVEQAFSILDKDGSGALEVSDIVGVYDASKHPDVLSGKKTESAVFREFLDTFDGGSSNKGDGLVTPKEFEEYYANVSASIDDDDYFELMMRNAWHISGGEGWCANTSNRRVHVKFTDGSQSIEEVPNDMAAGNDPDRIKDQLEDKFGAGSIVAVSLTGEFEDGDEGAGARTGMQAPSRKSAGSAGRGTPGGDSSFVFG